MKTPLLWIIALAALPGQTLVAQNLTGSWQGTLKLGDKPDAPKLRIVFKVSTTDGDTLKASMYSIDQSPQGIATNITKQGSNVTMVVPGIGGTFEGKLSSTGIPSQGSGARERARSCLIWRVPPTKPPGQFPRLRRQYLR